MAHHVRFMPQALGDLKGMYDYIAPRGGDIVARDFVARLHGYCLGLDTFPERGVLRPDIHPDLRLLGYRRRATIAFIVHEGAVVIIRILGRGQDVDSEIDEVSALRADIQIGLESPPDGVLDMGDIKREARRKRQGEEI